MTRTIDRSYGIFALCLPCVDVSFKRITSTYGISVKIEQFFSNKKVEISLNINKLFIKTRL